MLVFSTSRLRPLGAGAVVALALGIPAPAGAALFFLFRPTTAAPGDRVSVRLGGTPATFRPVPPAAATGLAIRVYLARSSVAPRVHSRFDRRLVRVATIRTDRNGRGVATFTVPPIASGEYVAAAWCRSCATSSNGRTFFTFPVGGVVPRYRRLMLLHVR